MKQAQLQERLGVLVSDFGYETVRKTLREIQLEKSTTANHHAKNHRVGSDEPTAQLTKKRIKPNAANVVKLLDITDHKKKTILFLIAEKYEAKKFMPNVNHVRDFLGGDRDVSRIKSRQQVTSAVFKKLARLETMQLREMLDRGFYGPPKTLQPIARAIEGFSRPERSA